MPKTLHTLVAEFKYTTENDKCQIYFSGTQKAEVQGFNTAP